MSSTTISIPTNALKAIEQALTQVKEETIAEMCRHFELDEVEARKVIGIEVQVEEKGKSKTTKVKIVDPAKEAEKEAKKAEKEAREAEKEAKKAEKEAASPQAEKEAEKAAKKEKEVAKAAKEVEKEVAKAAKEAEKEVAKVAKEGEGGRQGRQGS